MSTALLLRRAALIISLCLFCLPVRIARADGNNYSDAALISSADFLKELKEVSLTLKVDPWITKYVSEDDIRTNVTNALDDRGIKVVPKSPVSLLVTLDQKSGTIHETKLYTDGSKTDEDYHTHLFYYETAFFVRAAAFRNGKFHLVMASPAHSGTIFTCEEGNETRRAFFGDEVGKDLKKYLATFMPQPLDAIASYTTADTTPWPADGWSGEQKAAANDAYTTFMKAQPKAEKRSIDGLDTAPNLDLTSTIKAEGFAEDPSWKKFWKAEVQQFGWVKPLDHPTLSIEHHLNCMPADKNAYAWPDYYELSDEIKLAESNLVFELNGRLVRKPAAIFSYHRTMIAAADDLNAVFQGFLPRSLLEFDANLKLGEQTLPDVVEDANPLLKEVALGMKFARIEAGMFSMGSTEGEEGRAKNETQHQVTLTKPFLMATNDVTRGQFAAFVADADYKTDAEKANEENTWRHNKVFEQEDTHPVVDVSWNDATAFLEWLSRKDHKTYRLPTEAEWEYACRAGTTTPFNTGATIGADVANYNGDFAYGAGVKGVNRAKTTAVGSFPANQWGLYDMHGNVWQWCSDVYGDYPASAVSDPTGPAQGAWHVLRGGSYVYAPLTCRSASRYWNLPDTRYNDCGFRVVLDAP